MRACEVDQLALKPFSPDNVVLVVGEDRVSRQVALGGAGRFGEAPALTLFVPAGATYPVGSTLTVNLLPAARPAHASVHLEDSESIRAPRIAESRLAFECVVMAKGSLDGPSAEDTVLVARVSSAHQRWPRGCAAA